MNFTNPLWPRCHFLFKLGGTPATPAVQAPPAPAASPSAIEVSQQKVDAKRQARDRMGIGSTILNNPSLTPAQSPGGKNTLLGGG